MKSLALLSFVMPWATPPPGPTPLPASIAARSGSPLEGFVVIPVDEYQALRLKAYPKDPEAGPPPVEWALTRIDCDLRIEGDSARGEARLTVDVLKDGWIRLPLSRFLKVRSARVEGRPVALIAEPGRDPAILLSKTGRVVISLDIATPVIAQGGEESFSLPASGAGVFRVVAHLERPAVDVTVSGGVLASTEETPAETRVSLSVRPGENLSLHWRRRAEASRTTLPARFRSTVTELVGLGEESALITTHATMQMTQGAAGGVTFSLPPDFVVNQVSGALMADWEFKPGSLSVTFLEPVAASAQLVLQGESKAAREGLIEIPLLRMNGAERETGGVAVEVLGAGEIKSERAQGLDRIDPGELGDVLAGRDSPSLSAFRLRPLAAGSRTLSVEVARYTPQAVLLANIEEARYESLVTEEGKRLTRARYAVRNNQRTFLTIALPKGAILWSASIAGRPVRPGVTATGALLLPLRKTRGGDAAAAFPAEIIYFERAEAWTRDGRATVILPTLDLPVSRTGVLFHHSPEFRLSFDRGTFRVTEFEAPVSLALIRSDLVPPGPAAPMPNLEKKEKDARAEAFQGLVDRFRQEARIGRLASSLPVPVSLPEVGSAVFVTSELTGEGTTPSIVFAYRKGGRS